MAQHVFGDVWNLREIKRSLKDLAQDQGRRCAQTVAKAFAPKLTAMMREAFETGQTIFGESRPLSVDGNPLSLVKSGEAKGYLQWIRTGTIVRAAMQVEYARYLVGKYKIMPSGAQELPFQWQHVLVDLANETIQKYVDAGNGLAEPT